MEPTLSSNESCDTEIKTMKNQLTEYGFDEDNLSKEEMIDILKALNNSKSSVKEDEMLRQKEEEDDPSISLKKPMRRRYLNVRDRRMPWSLLPTTITQAEKARALAVYIKLMSLNNHRQARLSVNFASWPPPIQIIEETSRSLPMRSTRSGRSVPIYSVIDDDSDLDFVITKPKKRKVSNSDQNNDGTYTNKVISLKRKINKDENARPPKEPKVNVETNISLEKNTIA